MSIPNRAQPPCTSTVTSPAKRAFGLQCGQVLVSIIWKVSLSVCPTIRKSNSMRSDGIFAFSVLVHARWNFVFSVAVCNHPRSHSRLVKEISEKTHGQRYRAFTREASNRARFSGFRPVKKILSERNTHLQRSIDGD
jgi:hypothetical protein